MTITVSHSIYLSVSWTRVLFRNRNCRTKKMLNKKQNVILDKKVHMNRVTNVSEFCRSRRKGEIGNYMVRHVNHVKQIRHFSRLSDSRQPIYLFFYFYSAWCSQTFRNAAIYQNAVFCFFVSPRFDITLFQLIQIDAITPFLMLMFCSQCKVRWPLSGLIDGMSVSGTKHVGQCSVVWYRAL